MNVDDIRYLFEYDRWATKRVLDALDGVPHEVWSRRDMIGELGLGGILVHHLGATQRWRHWIQQTGVRPAPEEEPLISVAEFESRWATEWDAYGAWIPTMSQGLLDEVHDGVAVWRMLAHVVNHGTQHRSEAAALLTEIDRSPGEIDMIFFAEGLAAQAVAPAD
ncbi:MAG: DinB family protein [Chloroflexota bacterium]|jgi:uncharacterized damage-inducible protein DinB